jgi:hypothetical protein
MDTNNLFKKIASWEELSQEEKLGVAKESISRKTEKDTFEKMLSWKEVSLDEKIEVARWLIAQKVADILMREMVVSHLSWEKTSLTLKARDCRDSNINIKKFLVILWARDVKVSSDFPAYNEDYEGTTSIEFTY